MKRELRTRKCVKCGAVIVLDPGADSVRKFCDFCAPVKRQVTCVDCGFTFTHYGRGMRLRCRRCANVRKSKSVMAARALKDPAVHVGVGSGGNQLGEDNSQWNPQSPYRTGPRDIPTARKVCYLVWEKECVLCASTHRVMVHHIDTDTSNNSLSNLVPLCSKCHRALHARAIRHKLDARLVLEETWPESRSKIAEKIGKAEMLIRPEGAPEGAPGATTREEGGTPVISPRGRDRFDGRDSLGSAE